MESLIFKVGIYVLVSVMMLPVAFVVQYAWNANVVGLFGAPHLEYGNAFWLAWLLTFAGRTISINRHER